MRCVGLHPWVPDHYVFERPERGWSFENLGRFVGRFEYSHSAWHSRNHLCDSGDAHGYGVLTAAADADVLDVAKAIVKIVDMPFGTRPFRVHIDPAQDGAEIVNGVADRVRAELLRNMQLADLLKPSSTKVGKGSFLEPERNISGKREPQGCRRTATSAR